MTPSTKLSQLAADKLFGPHDNEGEKIIEQHCCLKELFEVVRAAESVTEIIHTSDELENAITALRSKLKEKGVEL